MKQIETAMFAMHAEAKAAKLAANPNAITHVAQVRSGGATRDEGLPAGASAASIAATLRADAARAEEQAFQERARAQAAAAAAASAARPMPAFYRVQSVSPDSPADAAGLRVDDLVLQFGSVTASNVTPAAMAAVVSSSVGKAIPVTVQREGTRKELRLVPQAWGGRGMLGSVLEDQEGHCASADGLACMADPDTFAFPLLDVTWSTAK